MRCLLDGSLGAEVDSVTVLDKLTYAGNLASLAAVSEDRRYSFVQGDICDGSVLDHVVPGHDVVVNFAAETHVDRSITGPQDFVVTNVVGTQALLDACRRHGTARVVHIGTDEVYGSIDIGGGVELNNRQLTERILEHMDCAWEEWVDYVPDRLGHDRRYSVDDSRLRALGYAPTRTFDEAIDATIAWYRDHPQWWRPLKGAA